MKFREFFAEAFTITSFGGAIRVEGVQNFFITRSSIIYSMS